MLAAGLKKVRGPAPLRLSILSAQRIALADGGGKLGNAARLHPHDVQRGPGQVHGRDQDAVPTATGKGLMRSPGHFGRLNAVCFAGHARCGQGHERTGPVVPLLWSAGAAGPAIPRE